MNKLGISALLISSLKSLSSSSFRRPLSFFLLSSSIITAFNFKTMAMSTTTTTTTHGADDIIDPDYPGTAVFRMITIRDRVKSLTMHELNGIDWLFIRRTILNAGGLKDLPDSIPGQGYTGHSFNDFNHCDLTAMRMDMSDNENEGRVAGIAFNNPLGNGIRLASLSEHGLGGSWSTCMMGCSSEPPQDVAHIQFRSRIAFKLVWCPPLFTKFVLVDDEGDLLNRGFPNTSLPHMSERRRNYQLVAGSKYAIQAELWGQDSSEL